MAIVACPNCGNALSPNAEVCPKCGDPANARAAASLHGNCATCGTQLRRADHKRDVQTPYLLNGTTHYRRSVSHTPCSSCGDPKPLRSWTDSNTNTSIVTLLGGAAIVFLLLMLYTYQSIHA